MKTPTSLTDLLPLKVPISMHIDPVNACNFRCSFCPTGDIDLLKSVHRPKGYMSMDLFKKIAIDLKNMTEKHNSRPSKVHLYKDGEPLLHPDLSEMISLLKQLEITDAICTTTNGSLMNDKIISNLISSGLDHIRISVEHVTDAGYKEITNTNVSYNTILNNIKNLYTLKMEKRAPLHVHVKIIDTGLSDEEKQKFYNDFTEISDSIHIDKMMGWSDSDTKDFMLGQEPITSMKGLPLVKKRICPQPFSRLAINFDGTASVCCVDWSHSTVVGDLNQTDLDSIWNGPLLHRLRSAHVFNRLEDYKACANCQYKDGLAEYETIDGQEDKLIALFNLTDNFENSGSDHSLEHAVNNN